MNQRLLRLIIVTFIVLDLLVVNIVFLIAKAWFQNAISPISELQYAYLHFCLNIAWIVAGWINSIYNSINISSFENFCKKSFRAYVYFIAFIMLYLFVLKQVEISRLFIVTLLISTAIGFLLNRLLYLGLFQLLLNKNYLIPRIIIIGHNSTARKLAQYLEEEPLKKHIIGFCEDEENINELTHYPVVGEIKNVMELARQYKATNIYSTIAPEQNHEIYSYMKQADQVCIRFKFIPDLDSFIRLPVHIDYLGPIPMFSLRKEPLEDISNRIRKRLYDLFISILVTVFILSWMIPLIGMLIWLEDRGPVFFIQQRSGKDNKPFGCIKFRSMRISLEANTKQATENDLRITRLGKFLRKTNLDEFPQFLNVLMSQMSVVGPRPHMLKHTDDYSKILNLYMVRHFMKPGITGCAQIKGYRGETKTVDLMQKRVENDIWYLENWSLWLDTKIVILTALNMITGDENAY